MKKRIIYSLAALLMTGAMSSCSNEENVAEERIDADKAEITINTEAYQADQDVTRAAWNRQTKTIDLGDGLTADVSIEADKQDDAAQTRASMSNEHYTIYALDGSSTRVATMTGTVTGGNKFTRDASSPRMILAPGTYTFVCINDAVTDNGTSLTVSNGTANPMIGTTTQTISGPGWNISFAMKHQTARVRLKVTSYTNEGTGLTASLSTTTAQPATAAYNADGTANTAANTTAPLTSAYTIAQSPVTPSAYVQTIERTSDYHYLLPGIAGSDISLTFNAGNIYGKALAAKTLAIAGLATLTRNGSYTVNIKLKTFPYYLFQDGTVGALGDKGSRTPIGIVVKEKTTTEKGLAIALKDANSDIDGNTGLYYLSDHYMNNFENVGTGPLDFQKSLTEMKGEYWTYDPAGNVKNDVRATEKQNYMAFYAAAHYDGELRDAGITLSNGMENNRWFLPSMGELALALKVLGKAQITSSLAWSGVGSDIEVNWDDVTADGYFTQAGGNALVTPLAPGASRGYATSSMNDIGSSYILYLTVQIFPGTHTLKFVHDMNIPFYTANVRPFVHF